MRFLALVALALLLVASSASAQGIRSNPYIQNIIAKVLPSKYPMLVAYARKHPEFAIRYKTQSGEIQKITVNSKDDGIVLTSIIHLSDASGADSGTAIVMMFDVNLDSRLDLVTYMGASVPNRSYSQKSPTDDASLFYWYTGLYAVIRFSDCCQ
jgi:hypothetical protein